MVSPGLDFLNSFFWQFSTFMVFIVSVIVFLVYRYYIEPPLSRQLTSAKWKGGTPAFIENEVGEVEFVTSDRNLPEGVKHVKGKGWFANAIRDVAELKQDNIESIEVKQKGPGRPPKVVQVDKNKTNLIVPGDESKDDEVLQMVTHTPILKGFGKQVFFGSTTSVALCGLKAIAHADLRKTRLLSPRMYSKTQLDALATGNRIEGIKMSGREQLKIIIICLAVMAPIAVTGIIAYLLMNGPK